VKFIKKQKMSNFGGYDERVYINERN
jgi:hypothetical protein